MERNSHPIQRGRPVSGLEAAHANEYFEQFLNASSLKHILGYYRGLIDYLHLKPNVFLSFYPKLRANLTSWKAKALWKKFDARASHKCYQKGKAATDTKVLVIGGGPCGLRTAIEAQLLGAKVVVIEKRDRFSRNNVLHLWPFVIEDLRMLGAKKFFGKFCAGAIDHISIRRLQCILLKVALLLGVEVHTEVSFEKLIEPNATEKTGWRAEIKPSDHPVSQYEFDVIIGADGKRNTLQGFTRKEFRGKLAIAITANFINKKTEAEARVEEISGVAFIFNQKFFKDLQEATRIDLENIVYYKDDTHYFVMTAKKASLIEKGVIKQDLADTEKLLAPDNVDRMALEAYAIEAASFSTNYQMPDLEFAVNHYGQPDIAMFDFTSMFAADNASKVVERSGYRLLMILVGDSLLEPFWPTGSGCARGFLSSLDAAWAIRNWSMGTLTPLDVLAERESIYRLLAQTTPDNLNKDWKSYTLDPATRYPNLNKAVVMPQQTAGLYDTDNPTSIERMKRNAQEKLHEVPKKRRRGNVDNEVLLSWISEQLRTHEDINVTDIGSIFKDGKILCAIIHHYRPDLLDYSAIKDNDPAKNNQIAFDVLEKELGIPPIMTGEEITNTEDYLTLATYLTQVYDTFKGEIPHIKHPKLELPESNKRSELSFKTIKTSNFQPVVPSQPSRPSSRHKRHVDTLITNKAPSLERKTRKRRTLEKVGASVEERQKMLEEIASNRADRHNRRRQQRKLQTEQFLKSMQMLQANARDPEPFEDYSIFLYRQTAPKFEDRVKDLEKQFTYIPDHDNKMPNLTSRTGGADEDLAARIKNFENKMREPQPIDKKPKDLLRAIGKIETSDWNIKEIEKKIKENKMGKPSKIYDKEKVPKWSKEQFLARQTKMEKQHLDRQDSAEAKFADIDRSIKNLDQKLKEGNIRELGQNKVASITEKLVSKVPQDPKPVEKTNTRAVMLPTQAPSEFCHFCGKRVYLMERLSAEGRFFHHGCFKCQYCNTQLRLGSYAFDRDGMYDHKFFCLHHFGMVGELPVTKDARKPSHRQPGQSPEKKPAISGVDLLDRVQTPERAEFANLSTGNASSDQEESISQMDEDEWTDKNFGASCAEMGDSDDDSSSLSDSDSEDEDAFDDALEEPVTKEGTMKWADRWKNSYSRKRRDSDSNRYSSSDQSSYYENSSDDDDSDTATEGEEEIRARELRKQEVRVEPPIVQTDTGTDTEIVSDETSSESSSEIQNSATEISTDSEFAHDDPTPTREIPAIVLNDFYVTKTRGSGGTSAVKKIQVTSGYLQRPTNGRSKKPNIELKLKPLVPSAPTLKKPAPILLPRTEGYALNRTQSTGGIAAKVSLELKKRYLLGETAAGSIQKSGSASTLDSKFKTFHTNISDCQKLLKPAKEISASMQKFCNKLDERHSPIISPQLSIMNLECVKPEELTNKSESRPPPPDVTNVTSNTASDNKVPELEPYVFQNESEGRPRSPVHETSIIVPEIDWNKKNQSHSSDSLCTSSSDNEIATSNHQFETIPTVKIHEVQDEEDIPQDSLCINEKPIQVESSSLHSEPSKSITTEKKTLNQPKCLPDLEKTLPDVHKALHVNLGKLEHKMSPENDITSIKHSSGMSSPDSGAEQATAALTETELSDWARDGAVSDDFEDVEYAFHEKPKKLCKKPNEFDESTKIVKIPDFNYIGHICGKEKEMKDFRNKTIITETMNSILSANLDNIEFMDTGTETSSDDGVGNSQDGYVLFKDEDDFAEDSLNPNINDIVEATNLHVDEKYEPKNTGYCIVVPEKKPNGTVIDLKPSDLEKLKQKQMSGELEEDSLLVIETGTTTEENTCSDSTVKNITEISADKTHPEQGISKENKDLHKQKLEEKLAKVKEEMSRKAQNEKEKEFSENKTIVDNNIEFEEHCQRLQSKVEFGNVKDSIDIRKSRRKSKSDSPQKPDLIQEEKLTPLQSPKSFVVSSTSTPKTPDILYKKEILQKERDVNQKLIQEMVMNKMKSENKSLERKKRNKQISPGINTNAPYSLSKSATTDVSQINKDNSNRSSVYSTGSSTYTTPDVLLSTNLIPLQNSQSVNTMSDLHSSADVFSTPLSSVKEHENHRPVSVYSCINDRKNDEIKPGQPLKNSENYSMPDIRKNVFSDDFSTPKAPPRLHRQNDETNKTAEKLKQDARARAKLLSNEELGLSPEEKLLKLREKICKRGKENEVFHPQTDKINSKLYLSGKSGDCVENTSNYTFKNSSAPVRTKSVSEFPKNIPMSHSLDKQNEILKICKSDPNLLDTVYVKPKKKNKDRERRKSITKLLSTLFTKKSPNSGNSKGLFSKLSPKSKDISKEVVNEEPPRRKSLSEIERVAVTPPPIPPLPLNYTIKDESSEGELDCQKHVRSSCDTLDKSGILEVSTSSLTGRKTSKSARKIARQAQLKRHRMAQEIQRKLEETEVKTRELEMRGVVVEKALRGEDAGECHKDESELLQEWFDLMRDRTELRRFEKELTIRAQELELEDRHARLQHELRERLESNEQKTEEDMKIEEGIINEMMEIVSKRDSLIAVIEEDRLRYSNEDRDLEEQMLAKGLRLTPIRKSSEQ